MKEIWKEIKGYEGIYQISNLGNIRSMDRIRTLTNKFGKSYTRKYQGRMIRQTETEDGYLRVALSDEYGNEKHYRVHRLVAETFIPNVDNKPEVNHIDENKKNNQVDNLEWVTRLENARHGTRPQRCAQHNKKKVLCVTTGEVFDCIKSAAIKYSCDPSSLGKACSGKYKTYKNMTWKFVEDDSEVNE